MNTNRPLDLSTFFKNTTYLKESFFSVLRIEEDLQTTIYFADPHSPWQRGLNENTNDILRFFFPKGTDFSLVSEDELLRVVRLINTRPRKCLDYLSPIDFISKKCCT